MSKSPKIPLTNTIVWLGRSTHIGVSSGEKKPPFERTNTISTVEKGMLPPPLNDTSTIVWAYGDPKKEIIRPKEERPIFKGMGPIGETESWEWRMFAYLFGGVGAICFWILIARAFFG